MPNELYIQKTHRCQVLICIAHKYSLDKNNITSKGASILFDTLRECDSCVTALWLSQNNVDSECMIQIGQYLQDNQYMEYIYLSRNEIDDKGIEILSQCICRNVILKEIFLDWNRGITIKSIPNLIEMIKKSHIVGVYLSNTSIIGSKREEIEKALKIPLEERETLVLSNSKSAAKIS